MKLLSKKVLGVPLLGVLLTLVLVGVAVAAVVLLSVPSSVNITSKEIGVYSDISCSTPVTTLAWGDVSQGTVGVETVYVKNLGTGLLPLIVSAEAVGLPTGVTLGAPPTLPLFPDDSQPMLLTLTVDSTATPGLANFTTDFGE